MIRLCVLLCCLSTWIGFSQEVGVDTIVPQQNGFKIKQLIIPSVMIGYGVLGLENDQIRSWDNDIRNKAASGSSNFPIDNITLLAPPAAVYVLNAAGIKGKNNFKDRSFILAGSYIIMGSTVMVLKSTTKVWRPDRSTRDSFPSGHTASAFAGAEFLWQEYKDVSFWYGIAGYAVAAGTGYLRLYNNRHWFTDVAAGAGIGILSTKAAYLLYPMVSGDRSGESKSTSLLLPFVDSDHYGLTYIVTF